MVEKSELYTVLVVLQPVLLTEFLNFILVGHKSSWATFGIMYSATANSLITLHISQLAYTVRFQLTISFMIVALVSALASQEARPHCVRAVNNRKIQFNISREAFSK